MAAIPGYERVVIKQSAVADTVDPQAIAQAGSGWNAAADVLDIGAQVSLKIKEEEKKSRLNEALIDKQRSDFDFRSAYEKQREKDPDGFATDLEKELQVQNAQRIKGLPEDLREPFRVAAKGYDLKTYESAVGWENDTRIKAITVSDAKADESLKILAMRKAERGEPIGDLFPQMDAMYVKGDAIYGAAENDKKDYQRRSDVIGAYLETLSEKHPNLAIAELTSRKYDNTIESKALGSLYETAKKARQEQALIEYKSMPMAEQAAVVGSAANPENLALDTILKNEGGYVAVDGASGEPALFGINRGAHKADYEAAEKITKERGQAAGQEYARQFYKREYFDKYEIGKLSPEVQTIVADGMVNHWQGFKTKLLQAAKDGASPDELISMRMGEYERLAAADKKYAPSLKGWLTRLDRLPRGATGTAFDYLAPEKKAEEYKKAQEFVALGNLPNPANATHQNLVDEMYIGAGLTQRLQKADTTAIDESVALSTKYGMIPKSMQTAVGGMITNGTTEQRVVGYSILDKISQMRPETLKGVNGFADDVIAESAVYNSLINSGMDTTKAMQRIDEGRKPINKEAFEQRSKEFDKADINANKTLSAFDDTFFSASPDMTGMNADYLTSQYKAQVRANYMLFGDMDAAQKAAKDQMTHVGVSRATGKKQLMAYPPEKYYSYGAGDFINNDEIGKLIQDQLYDQLVESGVTGKIKMKPEASAFRGGVMGGGILAKEANKVIPAVAKKDALANVILIPTEQTAASVARGEKPAYYIQFKNGFDQHDIVRGEDNLPVRWMPDAKKIQDFRVDKRAAEVKAANEQREALTKLRENPMIPTP